MDRERSQSLLGAGVLTAIAVVVLFALVFLLAIVYIG